MKQTARLALACLLLASCSPMTVTQMEVDGIPYVMYVDHDNPPCGTRLFNEGCYIEGAEIGRAIYVSSIAPAWVIEHEVAHVQGMRHTEWRKTDKGFCSFVIRSGGKYSRGDILCNNEANERIYRLGES